MDWDKPFLSFEQQVQYLQKNHGLTVNDPNQAARILQDVPYYDLINGYKEYTMTDDVFHTEMSFEFLYAFYLFDRDFQNILFKQSVLVENSFKNKMAYVLAKKFGVHQEEYLKPSNFYPDKNGVRYEGKNGVYETISQIFSDPETRKKTDPATGKIIEYTPKKKYPLPTGYYKTKHNHIPPWILLRNVTFSTVINLFSLMKPPEKREMISFYFPDSPDIPYKQQVAYVLSGINLIRKFRNTIAHDLKFVSFRPSRYDRLSFSVTRQIFPSAITEKPANAGKDFGRCDIYAFILALLYFLHDDFLRRRFCFELSRFFYVRQTDDPNDSVLKILINRYSEITGLPSNMTERFRISNMSKF